MTQSDGEKRDWEPKQWEGGNDSDRQSGSVERKEILCLCEGRKGFTENQREVLTTPVNRQQKGTRKE